MTLDEIMKRREAGETDESIVQEIKKCQANMVYTPEQLQQIKDRALVLQDHPVIRRNQKGF